MTAAYHTSHTMDDGFNDGGSDDSEMEVWDETEVAAVETSIRESARGSSHESVTQWGNAYFRPGTAPEAERVVHNSPSSYNDNTPTKKALSSPPTSLSEVNFALRSAARQAQKYNNKSSSRPPSGAQAPALRRGVADKRGERGLRSGSAASVYGSPPVRATGGMRQSNIRGSTAPQGEMPQQERVSVAARRVSTPPTRVSSGGMMQAPASNVRASPSRKSETSGGMRQERKTMVSSQSVHNSPQQRPPPKPATPGTEGMATRKIGNKQRKAASARITRPELPIHALYSQVYQEEGAPVPQGHPQMQVFQKRSRPPSRHRSPQDSLGLDVQPQPIPPRMRSAHYPSHHERPPSRCKPPPECVYLEDAEDEEEAARRVIQSASSRPGSSRSRRGATPGPEGQTIGARPGSSQGPKRPVSGTPSRTMCENEFDNPNGEQEVVDIEESSSEDEAPLENARWGEKQDTRESARAVISGVSGGPGALNPKVDAVKKKPSITTVPFRTSLSEDFLRLFAPAGSAAPPTPPKAYNAQMNNLLGVSGDANLFGNTVSMGLTDIPSPTDDLFGPFVDKEMYNKTFEDLCISDDDSEDEFY